MFQIHSLLLSEATRFSCVARKIEKEHFLLTARLAGVGAGLHRMPKPAMKDEKLHSQRIEFPADYGVLSKLLMQMMVQLKVSREYGK